MAHPSDIEEQGRGTALRLRGLRKSYGEVAAVAGIDLEIEPGATCALLGPSGCGKTTTLRLIAGLETPDEGSVEIGSQTVSTPSRSLPPERRRIGMVFQDYALFPHLDVAGNVGYGLGRRPDRGTVESMLETVGLGGLGARHPHELSGGQQQRVALARALVTKPRAVLLDEPFSNLDAGLREKVRREAREILDAQGVTSVFVTHDQEEALSVADVVAVMNEGRVEQVGTPEEVYSRPASRWVAGFLGEIEVLPGMAENGSVSCELGRLPNRNGLSGEVDVLIRPESVAVGTVEPPDRRSQDATVVSRNFYGHDQMIELRLPSGRTVRARRLGFPAWHPGDRVRVWIDGPADVLARD
ncbi:MAG TPA: ABC transporter ATP-binding protein [Solirubrobacterales bacterium]|nr:ABC transporter ATP-binding protein [Solirubrobacterales bacterium]